MDIHVRGKNMPLTDALTNHVEKKLGKLARHFGRDPVAAEAVLSVEKDRQMIEVTLPVDGRVLRGQESTPDMYASVDLVVQKLERQLERLKAHTKGHSAHAAPRSAAPAPTTPPADSVVVRRKTFPVKPMSLDEAVLQMNLVSHDFFAFTNAETDRISVLYRRRDGTLGLLEPS